MLRVIVGGPVTVTDTVFFWTFPRFGVTVTVTVQLPVAFATRVPP